MNSLTEILRSYKECQDKNAFKELDNMIYDYLSQAAIEQKDLLIEACKEVLEPCADKRVFLLYTVSFNAIREKNRRYKQFIKRNTSGRF